MVETENDYSCHKLPKEQWCDHAGPGGFMGHTCIKPPPKKKVEQNLPGARRCLLTQNCIKNCIAEIDEKIKFRLSEKGRGSYIGNHETHGILAEEFHELLHALEENDDNAFYLELIDIAVGGILGMASMHANKQNNRAARPVRSK